MGHHRVWCCGYAVARDTCFDIVALFAILVIGKGLKIKLQFYVVLSYIAQAGKLWNMENWFYNAIWWSITVPVEKVLRIFSITRMIDIVLIVVLINVHKYLFRCAGQKVCSAGVAFSLSLKAVHLARDIIFRHFGFIYFVLSSPCKTKLVIEGRRMRYTIHEQHAASLDIYSIINLSLCMLKKKSLLKLTAICCTMFLQKLLTIYSGWLSTILYGSRCTMLIRRSVSLAHGNHRNVWNAHAIFSYSSRPWLIALLFEFG